MTQEQYHHCRGGVAGPAGPALAGPLFSGSLVSCPDCRDGLRTRRLGQVSHASSPLPCVHAFLVIVPALLPADQDPGAGPTGLHRHPHVAKYTWAYDVQLLAIWRIPLLAVVLLSLALRVGLLRRLSTSPCLSLRPFGKKNVVYRSFQPSWFASWLHYLPVVDPPPPPPPRSHA